ncbi:hypothetical protein KCP70_25325 [Salmonella enterica subsp. enterica]|nr:hypothetical protein KCP70_25325 [Salmonella enterica subsp. enterica]
MLSVLDDEQYRQLSAVAHSLKMGIMRESAWRAKERGALDSVRRGQTSAIAICAICRLI